MNMPQMQNPKFQNPTLILQTAIEELDVFTQVEASRLEVNEEGRLVAAKETRLERVVGLARAYIGPLFSEQVRQKQESKLRAIKKAILQARDIIQSHSALIEQFKEGDDAQRKLAEYALLAIQRYNAVVAQEASFETIKYDIYNYERHCLLLDQEIKGQPIELPYTLSVKYDSHPDVHPARKMLKKLSETFLIEAVKKERVAISCPKHKKTLQFMIDTFHMKAIRMIQTHLSQQNSMAEILQLVKRTPLDIDDESHVDLIKMQQLIEVGPGSFILVTGCFKRHASDPKFMTMPILDSFRLSFELTHSGFPYPSQHTGWALADKWIEAYPLRSQVPLFQTINERRKHLAHRLLFDQTTSQKARRYAHLKRTVFDQHRALFLPLHRQLQQALRQNISHKAEDQGVLEAFYQEVAQAPSAYELLTQTQQQLLDLFIKQPIKALEEEWLGMASTPMRRGSPQEKFQAACQKLEQQRQKATERLDETNPQHAYILQQGIILGEAFQAIGLQYQSEKMGFSPPLLNDFERRLQACAFQQLLLFLDECDDHLDVLDPDQIKTHLLNGWSKDFTLLQAPTLEQSHSVVLPLINELETYFQARFNRAD